MRNEQPTTTDAPRHQPRDAPAIRHVRWCVLALCVVLTAAFGAGSLRAAAQAVRCTLADGFDFPVGKPDASKYYKSRGFYPGGHRGEDWNGSGGGDSDLGDPIWCIGAGVVVLSENVGVGWGNVVIVRHAFRGTGGKIEMVDSLYGHLLARHVQLHQIVARGQQIGTMGSNNGMYPAHLHLEIRKDLRVGMNRSSFPSDYSVYHSPTKFINEHRKLSASFQKVEIPVNTFAPYGKALSGTDEYSGPTKGSLTLPVLPSTSRPAYGPTITINGRPMAAGGAAKPSTPAGSSPSGMTRPPGPPPGSVAEEGDFWSRMKSKIKQGKLIDENGTRR